MELYAGAFQDCGEGRRRPPLKIAVVARRSRAGVPSTCSLAPSLARPGFFR
jgi:hypothetical protein